MSGADFLEYLREAVAPALNRIALELEIANRTRVLADFARLAAFDKKLLPDVKRARLDLNAALARRVP